MTKAQIRNRIMSIPIDRLVVHPCCPNRMSKRNFARLVRNIERTGRYEPLLVRRQGGKFQIINGHQRLKVLKQLGYENVDAVVWDVDNVETDILLCSLNRLKGTDVLDKKLALLERINCSMNASEMAKILPYTRTQIEKLRRIKIPHAPAKIDVKSFAVPMVFFLSAEQQQIITKALGSTICGNKRTRAAQNAAAITEIAECFIRKENRDED